MKEEILWPLVGGIITSVIAALVSLVAVILSKDQKTSEFRQAWIDALRDDVSKFVGIATALISAAEIVNKKEDKEISEYLLSKVNELGEGEFLLSRIRLRLNPKEHSELIGLIKWLQDDNSVTRKMLAQKVELMVDLVQLELKKEWERVKRGERSYRILKYSSAAFVLSSLAGSLGYGLLSAILK